LPFKVQLHMFQNQFRKLSAWAGILAPVIFVGVFTVEGGLRNGYDPMKMYISALSLGNRGWIQISNFIVLGLLLFIFTLVNTFANYDVGTGSRTG